MTPLKPNEKKLLIALGITGFLMLNFLGWGWISRSMLVLERKVVALESREKSLNFWKTQAAEAESRRDWIERNLKTYRDEADRETYLDAFIRGQAQELGLELRKNQPQEPRVTERFVKSRYTAEVSGPWPAVYKFIYQLQQPGEFRFVPRLQVTSRKGERGIGAEEGPAYAVCTLDIEKWWAPRPADEGVVVSEETADESPDSSATEQNEPDSVSTGVEGGSEPRTAALPAPKSP